MADPAQVPSASSRDDVTHIAADLKADARQAEEESPEHRAAGPSDAVGVAAKRMRLGTLHSKRPRSIDASSSDYFEKQLGAWCGMHALNNFLRGPHVDMQSCRAAAKQVQRSLGGADSLRSHLDPVTGYLRIDV